MSGATPAALSTHRRVSMPQREVNANESWTSVDGSRQDGIIRNLGLLKIGYQLAKIISEREASANDLRPVGG